MCAGEPFWKAAEAAFGGTAALGKTLLPLRLTSKQLAPGSLKQGETEAVLDPPPARPPIPPVHPSTRYIRCTRPPPVPPIYPPIYLPVYSPVYPPVHPSRETRRVMLHVQPGAPRHPHLTCTARASQALDIAIGAGRKAVEGGLTKLVACGDCPISLQLAHGHGTGLVAQLCFRPSQLQAAFGLAATPGGTTASGENLPDAEGLRALRLDLDRDLVPSSRPAVTKVPWLQDALWSVVVAEALILVRDVARPVARGLFGAAPQLGRPTSSDEASGGEEGGGGALRSCPPHSREAPGSPRSLEGAVAPPSIALHTSTPRSPTSCWRWRSWWRRGGSSSC